jgi:hypothetical protein
MIDLSLHISNPWYTENFKNIFNWSKIVWAHKVVEFEILRYSHDLLAVAIGLAMAGRDHAGPRIDIALFGYSVSLKMYDTRHWNYENNQWVEDDETARAVATLQADPSPKAARLYAELSERLEIKPNE